MSEAVAERLLAACRDWDGSEMSDEAEPINVRCELLRRGSQAILSLISQVREAGETRGVLEELRTAAERDYGSPKITLRLAQAILAADLALHGKAPSYRTRALEAESALSTLKREVEEAHAAMDEADPDLPRGDQRIAERFSHYVRGLASSGSVGPLALLSGRVGGSSGAAVVPDDWRCPSCHCHSWAHVDELKHDGHFGPGPEIRCVHCKRTFDLSAEVPSGSTASPKSDSACQSELAKLRRHLELVGLCPLCAGSHPGRHPGACRPPTPTASPPHGMQG